tara:strand:- start:49 stop:417 length:369 start_codon:yes stop_codon:yes gene_type:complete
LTKSKTKNFKKIICFDIDNTICKTDGRNYLKAKPKKFAIKKINDLYHKGFYIKLFTSRYMGRNNENISKAKKQGFKMTKIQLKRWNLKYHKLIFGKPSYDLFIDDRSLYYKSNWHKYINKYL